MNTSLTLTPINGEPRVHDLQLAERLGFAEPRMIRNLIKRNEDKLLKFGVCYAVEQTYGAQGGRPATEFYLNQRQAIFICMKSETDRAFDVQVEIVHVFDAYLNKTTIQDAPVIVHQSRLYRDLSYAVRVFDLSRDLFAKQMMVHTIKHLAQQMGIPTPDFSTIGKSADQMQLEV